MNNILGFQVHDHNILFYLTSLEFDNIYTMTENARIKVPKSVSELSSFLSSKNFHLLLYICQVFWSNCCIAPDQNVVTERFSPIVQNLYRFIDSSQNKNRECSLCFEA